MKPTPKTIQLAEEAIISKEIWKNKSNKELFAEGRLRKIKLDDSELKMTNFKNEIKKLRKEITLKRERLRTITHWMPHFMETLLLR